MFETRKHSKALHLRPEDFARRAPASRHVRSIALCAAVFAPLAAQAPTDRGAAADRPAVAPAFAPPATAEVLRAQPVVAPPDRVREVRRSELDQVLAAWVQADHRGAAALAKLAVDRAGSERVATFAAQARKQHLHCVEALAEFAPAAAKDADADGRKVAGDPAPEPVHHDAAPRGVNHAALVRELYRKRLETARAMLDGKSGAAFDRCYLLLQGVNHAHAVDAMQVFAERASPALKAVLEREIPAMQQHAKKAMAMALGAAASAGDGAHARDAAAAPEGAGDG